MEELKSDGVVCARNKLYDTLIDPEYLTEVEADFQQILHLRSSSGQLAVSCSQLRGEGWVGEHAGVWVGGQAAGG